MKLDDPIGYEMSLSSGTYRLLRGAALANFSGPLSTRGVPKLYTISDSNSLFYVGIAQQPMASRLRFGFRAKGESGYHGYKWKNHEGMLRLSVWTAKTHGKFVSLRDLETIEAEVAFCCRLKSGQWPIFQHEIHFYPSEEIHRDAASEIYDHAVTTVSL